MATTFEPLELQQWDTTHFKALDKFFLTVAYTKDFKLQGRIRKRSKLLSLPTKSEEALDYIQRNLHAPQAITMGSRIV